MSDVAPHLPTLLKNECYIYNRMKYQDEDSFVFIRGGHVCLRIYRLTSGSMNLERYRVFVENLRDVGKMNNDLVASALTKLYLKR